MQTKQVMVMIGVFWVYEDTVIGKVRELKEGEETAGGLIDSPDNHIDLWEHDPSFVIPFPELRGSEYQEVPRGRVMYSKQSKTAVVYLDKALHTEKTRKIIADFFQLGESTITWKTDRHYTTDPGAIDKLFSDDCA